MAKIAEISDVQKKYCSRAMIFGLAVAGVLLLIGAKPEAKGLILGTIFSNINFVMMGHALPLRITAQRKRAFAFSLGSIWFRYAVMAIPLVIAFYSESLEFFAVAAGLFMIQIIILAHHLGGLVLGLNPNR